MGLVAAAGRGIRPRPDEPRLHAPVLGDGLRAALQPETPSGADIAAHAPARPPRGLAAQHRRARVELRAGSDAEHAPGILVIGGRWPPKDLGDVRGRPRSAHGDTLSAQERPMTSILFSPLTIRGLRVRNRLWVAPMCQYSAVEGVPQEWHHTHLAQFASGGAGIVMAEATGVSPEGRISPEDTGIWNDEQVDAWRPIVAAIAARG